MEYLTNTKNIRNICILAHVDHGKTTIADCLIASNDIISRRMAGEMKYLDNRVDEQERGITMKSSCIALKFTDDMLDKYLVNLVDTPGHVDFCGEVSAAVRLCDGALIVVDVVEGVCPQTKAALEQVWKEGIEPILVLNKIDRLILEQKLDETAAYLRLNQLLEQVNAIVATLLITELFEDGATSNSLVDSIKLETEKCNIDDKDHNIHVYDWASAIEDMDDDKHYFMPEKNNVIFASSIDGWSFNIDTFAKILSVKHKINLSALRKTLWGDFYIDAKQKRIVKNAQARAKKTLFTSMVLENIWKIYETVCIRRDKIGMAKMCQILNIELKPRDLNHTDSRYQLKLVMSKWLELSKNILESVTKIVPAPSKLGQKRVERLLSSNTRRFQQLPEETRKLKDSFLECSPDSMVKVACISKMIPFDRKNLPENRKNLVIKNPLKPRIQTEDTNCPIETDACYGTDSNNGTVFIAFARVFSGKIRVGDQMYVLGPKHDPCRLSLDEIKAQPEKLSDLEFCEHVTVASVGNMYLLMGREIEKVDCALAGNIVGIQGLDEHLTRTATLSNILFCPPFNDLHLPATPILRVAIEPMKPLDMPVLENGLRLLNQADPCVEVKLQQTGEHVIIATGEVHLQRCINDLRERYTNNIDLNISQPIVPFRETVVLPPKTDMVNETIDDNNMELLSGKKYSLKKGIVEISTPNKKCKIKIRASPLPEAILNCLVKNSEILKIISKLITSKNLSSSQPINELSEFNRKRIEEFKNSMKLCIDDCRKSQSVWRHIFSEDSIDRIWSFGPKYSGPNILIADRGGLSDYIDSFISGFQLATQSGPLCEEPMMGVCFTILEWSYNDCDAPQETESHQLEKCSTLPQDFQDIEGSSPCDMSQSLRKNNYGPMSGQIISTVKDCCRRAFQAQPQRLMSPMFSCDIQVTTEVLGKMYAVLARRNGRIVQGDMREGSQTFEIKAFVPVIESLDFVGEIRKQTSGMANPQLIFSHYETIDVDPFWIPSTEEEYALFGDKADTENQAFKYMNLVRRRKGLSVQEKIVEHGEKQRTIKRNK